MLRKIIFIILFVAAYVAVVLSQDKTNCLTGKVVFLDAGHGGTALTDSYRVGPSGEREEWINLRVALLLQEMLEKKGAEVIMSRTADEDISLSQRAKMSREKKSDLFLSIHHNATADSAVNFPIIYFHGKASENKAGVALGREIAQALAKYMYNGNTPVSLVSDYTIFPGRGTGVLRGTYGIPGVIAEASFFTNPEEEERLKQPEHNQQEALGYLAAIEAFFGEEVPPILEKDSTMDLPPFRVFQEAERMNETAKLWYQDFLKGKKLMKQKESWQQAYDLFTRSARSFPDSYVAGESHKYRAILLEKMGKTEEAKQAAKRVQEYYVSYDE